jgi:hypothetical protein
MGHGMRADRLVTAAEVATVFTPMGAILRTNGRRPSLRRRAGWQRVGA